VADDPTWPDDAAMFDELARYVARESGHDRDAGRAIRRAWTLWSGRPLDREAGP
jgi:hypothetical protein